MNKNNYTNDSIHPCCNLILWDIFISFIIIMGAIESLFPNLSMFLTIILALVITGIFVSLMLIPYLGHIIHLLFTIYWALLGYAILEKIFTLSKSPLWQRIVSGLIVFLFALFLHTGSAYELDLIPSSAPLPSFHWINFAKLKIRKPQFIKPKIHKFSKNKIFHKRNTPSSPLIDTNVQNKIAQCKNQYDMAITLTNTAHTLPANELSFLLKNYIKNTASIIVKQYNYLQHSIARYNKLCTGDALNELKSILDDTVLMLQEYIEIIQHLFDDYNQNIATQDPPLDNVQISFFQGCNSLESLNKRYKDLVKVYHPDSGNGNDKVFIEITEEYEKLRPSFVN